MTEAAKKKKQEFLDNSKLLLWPQDNPLSMNDRQFGHAWDKGYSTAQSESDEIISELVKALEEIHAPSSFKQPQSIAEEALAKHKTWKAAK